MRLTFAFTLKSSFYLLWLALCRYSSRCEIEFLPVHTPSEAEIANPYLFAENVHREMARALNVACSRLAVDDVPYVTYDGDWRKPKPAAVEKLVQLIG